MTEPIDIAVELGVIPAPLPEIEFLKDFAASVPAPPRQIIDGILHQGCKLVLGGTSKSNKSWCLLDLAGSEQSSFIVWLRGCTFLAVEQAGDMAGDTQV